jgi:hypothetical protein
MNWKSLLPVFALSLVTAPLGAQSSCFDWKSGFVAQGITPPDSFHMVHDMLVWDDGSGAGQRLFAGGRFTALGGVTVNRIGAWDGTGWQPVGTGMAGFPLYTFCMGCVDTQVEALCLHDDGSGVALYAGGAWESAGGQPNRGLARWNGSTWTGISGVDAWVHAMASFDDGSGPALFLSGDFFFPAAFANFVIWRNGAFEVPTQVVLPTSFTVFDDGNGSRLYATSGNGGDSTLKVARWEGTSWSSVGGGLPGVSNALASQVHDDGTGAKLYVAGHFAQTGGGPAANIASWDGTSWSALGAGIGNGIVRSLASFPDPLGGPSKLIATGSFTIAGGAPANQIASWDGTSWSPLAEGVSGPLPWTLAVYDDHQGSGRDLYVGGRIDRAGGEPVSGIAKWEGCGGTGVPFCFGDGSLSSACPCGNTGASGHGCASSVVAAGGLLAASGAANPDTVVLAASELPSGVSCIFLQGDGLVGAGAVFGDGVRCAGGHLVRLALKSATGGAAAFPGAGDPSITARSAALGAPIAPTSSRFYQVYYRDNDPVFCPAPSGNTWNVTNGMQIHW